MPQQSEKELLKEVILMLGVSSMVWPQLIQTVNLTTDDTLLFLAILQFCRYVDSRTPVPKHVNPVDLFISNSERSEKYFRSQLRMDRTSFTTLLHLIQGHQVFRGSQEPIPLQLAVTLFRLGVVGHASTKGMVASKFGISPGSVHNFTERVLCAINSLAPTFIKWPLAGERATIGARLAKASLPQCVGFMSSSDAVLIAAPTEDREAYWSKRKRFSIQFQIIGDPDQQVRSFFTGYPGSTPDDRVYRISDPCRQAESYFSPGEYIIGDSAFRGSDTLVVPYRNRDDLSEVERSFNRHVASKWACAERIIGTLKGRFQSLRGLRIAVDGYSGHKRACEWIQACIVLHNFLVRRDPWVRRDEIHIEGREDDCADADEEVTPEGALRRDALCKIVTETTGTHSC